MRKTTRGVEKSILDIFVTCDRVLPYIVKMKVDENRENVLTNYNAIKSVGRVIESDHNNCELEVNLVFCPRKQERIEIFQFKNQESQKLFKDLTTNTKEFTNCFDNNLDFDVQSKNWRKVLDNFFHKAFKKIRVSSKIKCKKNEISDLMNRRNLLKKKVDKDDNDEEEIYGIEEMIANKCQETNRRRIVDNFQEVNGNNGNVAHQGIWKVKKKHFPKIKPSLPVAKKNLKGQLITNPEELKDLYLDTFKDRLRHRPAQPGYESLLDLQEELFELRLEMSKNKKTDPWTIADLEDAIKQLKTGKCRDPDGLIREIFKDEVMGNDMKVSLLTLLNKSKSSGKLPAFMQKFNVCAIYKGKGPITDLESDRGIFLVSIFRTIMMKMIYKDKYGLIDKSMSDSNIGARKSKNIRNHIFVVNSIIHDVLSKKSKQPVDIMVLDYKQMFDSECLFECMNDLFEAGVDDDIFNLIYEANRKNHVAIQTPSGLSRRDTFNEIVMQGDVLAPIISSLQVDTIGKECLQDAKHLYYYKDKVPIPPLGLVDDLFTISTCGFKTNMMNTFINSKTGMKRLQFGTSKCIKLHIGKSCNDTLCRDLFVGGWERDVVTDPVTGKVTQSEHFGGLEKMKVKSEQMYLGDIISNDGKHTKNIEHRKNKALGIMNQIMQILETVYFGKHFFEVALVLRSSLFLSSILLNSEAWTNLTDKDIRRLEQSDEILLSKILDAEANTSNTFKYLELGVAPLRFEIMKRKLLFLQYILKQEKSSMVYQVFESTRENPVKNDFVQECEKYLNRLNIKLTFSEIENMSKGRFTKLVKDKTSMAGFEYLIAEKNKQTKIAHIQYSSLEMQEYLLDGDMVVDVTKFIFKARSKTLDIKAQRKWKYEDKTCIGCNIREETGQEILSCWYFGKEESENPLHYDMFYGCSVKKMKLVARILMKKLKIRKSILDGG